MAETILIVEDNLVNQKLLLVILRPHGYHLLTAQDGEEAVTVATSEHPDLILMDLQLPKMSGYNATQLIKNNPDTATIRIIALTAHAMADERNRAQSIGFDGYITKPINTRTFPDQVKYFLQSSS
jgi:CheY-like chemotaxis protein